MALALPTEWERFRSQMPITRRYAYFDHASVSPLPAGTHQAIRRWNDEALESAVAVWSTWSGQVEATRSAAARLINAQPTEVTLINSTTHGITLVAEGYPWQPGDNVVLPAQEFPSNQYPWLNLASRGVEARRVPTHHEQLSLDDIAAHCDARTRLIAVSWVGYGTGWRNELAQLAELAHQRGALLFVDGIQGLGVLDLDVQQIPIDFLAADGHKWMLGPEGAGLLFVRREHLERLRPLGVGWSSVRHSGDFQRIALELKSSASRYEGGSLNMVGLIGFGASLELLLQHGGSQREERMLAVTDAVCEQLVEAGAQLVSNRDERHKSGIVAFDLPGCEPAQVKRHCLEQGVLLNARMGHVRVSPHLYTSQDDINRLLAGIRSLAS